MIAEFMVVGVIVAVLGLVCLVFAFKSLHKMRLIEETPTSKIRSMAMGLVEVKGAAVVAGAPLITPFGRAPCVAYSYRIEEYRVHHHRDSKGRTHTTHSWDQIASGERRSTFYVQDETGQAYVEPNGAEMQLPLKARYYQRGLVGGAFGMIASALLDWDSGKSSHMDTSPWGLQPLGTGGFPPIAAVGDRRYTEHYLSPGEQLYVLGTAEPAPGAIGNVKIMKGANEPTFIITYKSEKDVQSGMKWKTWGLLIGAVLMIVLGGMAAAYSLMG